MGFLSFVLLWEVKKKPNGIFDDCCRMIVNQVIFLQLWPVFPGKRKYQDLFIFIGFKWIHWLQWVVNCWTKRISWIKTLVIGFIPTSLSTSSQFFRSTTEWTKSNNVFWNVSHCFSLVSECQTRTMVTLEKQITYVTSVNMFCNDHKLCLFSMMKARCASSKTFVTAM